MDYRFRTFAVATEEIAGSRIEVACDGSLDEGDAIIRTTAEPGIGSSGVEYFVQLDADEVETLYAALTNLDSAIGWDDDSLETLGRIASRAHRLIGAPRAITAAKRQLGELDPAPYFTEVERVPEGAAQAAREVLVHYNVAVAWDDPRDADAIAAALTAAMDVGLEGAPDELRADNLSVTMALADEA